MMLFVISGIDCCLQLLLSLNRMLYKSMTSFTLIYEYFNPAVLKQQRAPWHT